MLVFAKLDRGLAKKMIRTFDLHFFGQRELDVGFCEAICYFQGQNLDFAIRK